jgi:hypothetical protein
LNALDHLEVHDVLQPLLDVDSAETRYGAFHTLHTRAPTAPATRGEKMRGEFYYHVIDSSAEPLIHLSRTQRPELVLFGHDEQFRSPFVVFVGKEFIIRGTSPDRVRVCRFVQGEEEVASECSARVDDVIRVMDRMGASYSHVIDMLREARNKRALAIRLAMDARPRPGRNYLGNSDGDTEEGEPDGGEFQVDLTSGDASDGRHSASSGHANSDSNGLILDQAQSRRGVLARIGSWLSPGSR